jgi:hypothetical protein
MLSRHKRSSALEETLAEEIFHRHSSRWRPLLESLRLLDKAERGRRRHGTAAEHESRSKSYWSPWLWMK